MEGVAGQIDLAAFAQGDAAGEDGSATVPADAQRGAGFEPPVVVVEPQILLGRDEQVQPQPFAPGCRRQPAIGARVRCAAIRAGRLIVSL